MGRWLTHLTQLWVLGYAETVVAETAPSSECSDKSVTVRRGAQLPLSYQRSRSCEKSSSVQMCIALLSYPILLYPSNGDVHCAPCYRIRPRRHKHRVTSLVSSVAGAGEGPRHWLGRKIYIFLIFFELFIDRGGDWGWSAASMSPPASGVIMVTLLIFLLDNCNFSLFFCLIMV